MNEDAIRPSTDSDSHSLDLAFDKGLQMAFPPVMLHLLQALLAPAPSFDSIAGYLKMDPMLAGKILHIVNTSSYSFVHKVTDLQRAAIAIGTSDLFKLVISLSLQKRLHPIARRDPEFTFGDWRITLWGALSAEALAEHFCPTQKREAYLAGMLKDLPLLLAYCRNHVPAFLQEDRYATILFPGQQALEMQTWGRSHQEMTRDIFHYWGMPAGLAEAVYLHHDIENVSQHTPLCKSLTYATKWAELLHSPETDPGQLVAFELGLAAELNFDLDAMEAFRGNCAEKFNLLLSQLSIQNARPETRLHDQSLSNLQHYYFLALGTLNKFDPASSKSLVAALQQQLRLFWNITTWSLSITLPGSLNTQYFRCDNGVLYEEKLPSGHRGVCPPNLTCLSITHGRADFGMLSFHKEKNHSAEQTLPMFLHMFGLCLKEYQRSVQLASTGSKLEDLPFALAAIGEDGTIKEASHTFLDTFGLCEVPKGHRPESLLGERLGISPGTVEKMLEPGGYGSHVLSAPDGVFPGTPMYIATCGSTQSKGESYLMLGDVELTSSTQSMALAHPTFLDGLLANIAEQVLLMSAQGIIIWADPKSQWFVNRDFFSLVLPESLPQDQWTCEFLKNLDKPATVKARMQAGETPAPVSITFTPLGSPAMPRYLVVLNRKGKSAHDVIVPSPATKQRDPLTGLYGYSQFHMLLKHITELATKQRVHTGILFCNLESLRSINHKYGYQYGDSILLKTGEAFAIACRPGKDYPCRYGADKFAVIATHATTALMDTMAKSIREMIGDFDNPMARIHIGLTLIPPAMHTRPYLDAAREAAKVAMREESGIRWAE